MTEASMHSEEESSKYVNDELVHIYVENRSSEDAKHADSRYTTIQLRDLKHDYEHLIRLVCRQCERQHYRSKGIPNATECESCGGTAPPLQYKCMECPKYSPSFSAAKGHLIYHCKPYFRHECEACDYATHSKKNMLQHLSYTKRVRGPARQSKVERSSVPDKERKENFRLTGLDQSLFSVRSRQVSMHEMSYLAPYVKVKCPNECSDPLLVYHYDQDKCCKSCDSEYTFACAICDKGSKSDKVTGSHIKVKHLLADLERTIKCNICPAKFCFNEDLKSHTRLTHRKGSKLNGQVPMSYALF